MKKSVSAAVGILFLASMAGNVAAGSGHGGDMAAKSGSAETAAQEMKQDQPQLKIREQLEKELHETDVAAGTQEQHEERVRTKY